MAKAIGSLAPILAIPAGSVDPDPPDLRDQFYSAGLQRLPGELFPRDLLRRLTPRQQGTEGSCTGQALATVVDLLRDKEEPPPPDHISPASARMLVEMARNIEQQGFGGNVSQPTNLRSALKAFYHYGLCLDDLWKYVDSPEGSKKRGFLTKEILQSARKLSLGAYYRLHPVLNDFHAALHEAGAVYVAAYYHTGWEADAVRRNRGCIRFDPQAALEVSRDGHAFAIVGYDTNGFLIRNSWGEEWGGFEGIGGLAHWSYQDWAMHIMDAWVVRLAVPTVSAFEFARGRQGAYAGFDVPVAAGSTPAGQVLGHYLHLDDGAHVLGGAYPSSQLSFERTVEILVKRDDELKSEARREIKYNHVLVWLAGANEGTKDAIADIARMRPVWTAQRIYPLTVLWCSDFVDSISDVLDGIFVSAEEQIGEPGEALDRQIETRARGAGRAFLRDIKHTSRRTARGPLLKAFQSLAVLAERGYSVHVAAEGVGAVLLADYMAAPKPKRQAALAFESVSLLAPTLSRRRFQKLVLDLRQAGIKRTLLATADEAAEQKMTLGPYRGSILRLVDRAFEDEGPETIVGLWKVANEEVGATSALPVDIHLQPLRCDPDITEPQLRHLTRGSTAITCVMNQVLGDGDRRMPIPPARPARAL